MAILQIILMVFRVVTKGGVATAWSGHRSRAIFSSTMTRSVHMMTCSARIATSKRTTVPAFSPEWHFRALTEPNIVLLKPKDAMRLLDLGCGSGAAADYLASRRNIEILCVTNSSVQADICRRKFASLLGVDT